MDDPAKYLDPLALAKVRGLELQARLIVEGYLSGMHKSPYHGFSVEFAQHREYVPGDDIRHIDWKVYARTGRFVLKQYEEETNLVVWLLVDCSESMLYSSGPKTQEGHAIVNKYDYACMAASALAHLALTQQDSAALATFDSRVRDFLRPSTQQSHLKQIVNLLEEGVPTLAARLKQSVNQVKKDLGREHSLTKQIIELGNKGVGKPDARLKQIIKQIIDLLDDDLGEEHPLTLKIIDLMHKKTRLGPIFHELAERIPRRSIVVVLSDLFSDVRKLLLGLQHLRHKGHEVVMMQVLDRAELEFPFWEATLFHGLEGYPELLTDPRALRAGYLEQFNHFLDDVKQGCRSHDIDYVRLMTNESLGVALSAYLAHRLART